MLRGGYVFFFSFFVALLAVSIATPATAKVSGPCANCHTMHDSQDGAAVAERYDGYLPNSWPLLSKDCVSCHSADDGSTWQDPVTGAPIVYNRAEPTYGADAGDGQKQGLAAGNFYWVDQDDTFGHNIFAQDPNLERAPGWRQGCALSCHNNLWRPTAYEGTGYARQCTKCHIADMFYEVKKKGHD